MVLFGNATSTYEANSACVSNLMQVVTCLTAPICAFSYFPLWQTGQELGDGQRELWKMNNFFKFVAHVAISFFALAHNLILPIILVVFILFFSSFSRANETEGSYRVIYLYYSKSDPDQVEYSFTTATYPRASDCEERLVAILKEQQDKHGSLIVSYDFKKNWTEFGGESYLVINRLDDLRQFFMCKKILKTQN